MDKTRTANKELSSSRKLLFRSISLVFPLIILFLIEGILRIFSYGDQLKLFIPVPRQGFEQYMMVNPGIGKKYFQHFNADAPANDIFLKNKPEGTFRIFVMGSSTVVGFPYGDNLMFSRILHLRLQEAMGNRPLEVVNTSITAINSFTLADWAREVAACDPDAVLVYAGHNEFYGAFGVGSNEQMSKSRVLTRLHLQLMDLRFYQLLRNITMGTIGKIKGREDEEVHGTLMKRIVADSNISLDSGEYKRAMLRYRQNMDYLVRTFHKKDIPVFLSQVISNVKDIKPFSALSTGEEDQALRTYDKAQQAFLLGNYDEARELYGKAKDLDGVRFRASEEVNRIIHELSQEYHVFEVPMISSFREHSAHGIIGNELLTEHVHPNIKGSFVMADAFYREVIRSGILWDLPESRVYPLSYYQLNWGYTGLDTLQAWHRITNLKGQWPFVPAGLENQDYRFTYKPVSEEDSIAFRTLYDPEAHLPEMRLALAREYDKRGWYARAFSEYNALLYTNPYLAINYRDAATALIRLGDLPLAMKYFRKSMDLDPGFYAQYRIGEINLIRGDYKSARADFEKAFSLTTDRDEQIKTMGKIYMACVYGGQVNDARAVAGQLKKYDAESYLRIPPRKYTYMNYIPFQTRNQVQAAMALIDAGKADEALQILEKSLEIYDSQVARRLMGEICLQEGKNKEALAIFQEVYDEFRFDPIFAEMYTQLKAN